MICSELRCGAKVFAHGLCQRHYYRFWRASLSEGDRAAINARQIELRRVRLANMTFDEETQWLERKRLSSNESKRRARANGRNQ